jgi:hypothetical protein
LGECANGDVEPSSGIVSAETGPESAFDSLLASGRDSVTTGGFRVTIPGSPQAALGRLLRAAPCKSGRSNGAAAKGRYLAVSLANGPGHELSPTTVSFIRSQFGAGHRRDGQSRHIESIELRTAPPPTFKTWV